MLNKTIYVPSEEDRQKLLYYAMGKFGLQKEDAEDLVQETIMKYWLYFIENTAIKVDEPKAYLFKVLRNAFVDYCRKHSRQINIEKVENDLEEYMVSIVSIEKIEKTVENFIARLAPDVRAVIELYRQGKSNKEIAANKNISIHKVNNILRHDRYLGKILKQIEIDLPF